MSTWSDLYQGRSNYDFVGNRKIWFTISGVALTVSLLSLAIFGLNLGVDFVGGTVVESPNPASASVEEVRSALGAIGRDDARVQSVGAGEGIRVQTEELETAAVDELVATLAIVAGVDEVDVSVQAVGPTFGEQVAQKGLQALLIFLAIITVFISFRFEWKMAAVALAALLHDLIITIGVYSLVGFEVTPATLVAVLTILGYSLYDTVVVFDKVEEQIEEKTGKDTISGIVNTSLNKVLMRSVNTSLTSLLPVGSLLFVGSFLLGAATLREFALALFVGIAAGTYSSIFFAAPLLATWKERETDWQRARRRAARKGTEQPEQAKQPAERGKGKQAPAKKAPAEEATAVAVEDPQETPEPETKAAPKATGGKAASGATPRPPKRRRRKR